MALNRARVVQDITLEAGANGFSYVVVVEFFDSADVPTVLWPQTFLVPLGATTTQLQATIVARGQEVRAALAAQASARATVPINTTIPVT